MAKLDAFARQIRVDAKGLTEDLIGKELARIAKAENARIQTEHRPSETQTFVDGRQGAVEETARESIVYRYSYWAEIIDEVWRMLVEASPVGPAEGGHYRDDHWLFVNGHRRDAPTEGGAVDIPPNAEVVFVNTRPYARKIEGGMLGVNKAGRRGGLSDQAPNGVYEMTAKAARSRFGNVVDLRFEYRAVAESAIITGGATAKASVKRGVGGRFAKGSGAALSGGQANRSNNRWPAIVMRLK